METPGLECQLKVIIEDNCYLISMNYASCLVFNKWTRLLEKEKEIRQLINELD
jgi:hypothetical protein